MFHVYIDKHVIILTKFFFSFFLAFYANASSTLQLNMEEFLLGNILDAIVSQVMMLIRGKNLQLFHEIPEEIKTLALYGDQIRLQVVLSDFLLNVVSHTPSPNGWVEIKISPGLKIIQDGNEFIHLKFRYTNQAFVNLVANTFPSSDVIAHFTNFFHAE